jgi:hypothetical protein
MVGNWKTLNLNTPVMGLDIQHHQVFTMTQSTPLHSPTIARNTTDRELFILHNMNWNNITIHQLQEIHSCRDMSNIERTMNILAIVNHWSMDKVESMPIDDLTREFKKLEFLNELPNRPVQFMFKHKGRYFRLAKTPNEICGHHFIELQQVFNGDTIESLHKIMALLAYEVDFFGKSKTIKDAQAHYQDKCDLFLSLDVPLPYSYSLFFSAVYPELLKTIQSYLIKEMEKLNKEITSAR